VWLLIRRLRCPWVSGDMSDDNRLPSFEGTTTGKGASQLNSFVTSMELFGVASMQLGRRGRGGGRMRGTPAS